MSEVKPSAECSGATPEFEVDYAQYLADLEEAFEDLRAERWMTLEEFDREMRQKYGIPGTFGRAGGCKVVLGPDAIG